MVKKGEERGMKKRNEKGSCAKVTTIWLMNERNSDLPQW